MSTYLTAYKPLYSSLNNQTESHNERSNFGELYDKVVQVFKTPRQAEPTKISKNFLNRSCEIASDKIDYLVNKFGRFGAGVIVGSIAIKPLTLAITWIADTANLLPEDYAIMCSPELILSLMLPGIIAETREELLFRLLIQDILLTRIPKAILKKFSPGKEKILDTKLAKTMRITSVAFLFSAAHWTNTLIAPKDVVIRQMFSAFFGGLGYGLLKESKAGVLGSIGAHISFNYLTGILDSYYCLSMFNLINQKDPDIIALVNEFRSHESNANAEVFCIEEFFGSFCFPNKV